MDTQNLSGACQCGDIHYELIGEPLLAAICHCSMCRRANAAPMVAWAMFHESQVHFRGAPLRYYASSSEAQRGFCPRCGSQISFTASFLPGLIDITLGSLDEPEALRPTLHYWHDRHLSWVVLADGLPRHPELPPLA